MNMILVQSPPSSLSSSSLVGVVGRRRCGASYFYKNRHKSSSTSSCLSLVNYFACLSFLFNFSLLVLPTTNAALFNYEVEKRVFERIDDIMNGPVVTNNLTEKFRSNGGFVHNMDARDRDEYLTYAFTYMQQFPFDMVYYGLEDGVFLGYGRNWGTYREPIDSGYTVEPLEKQREKYYHHCMNRETGEKENCTMAEGTQYIKCIHNCELEICPDKRSQTCYNHSIATFHFLSELEEVKSCKPEDIKYCTKYEILTVASSSDDESHNNTLQPQQNRKLGFGPRYYYCHDSKGRLTQELGKVMDQTDKTLFGNCYYGDGVTLVNHTEYDKYAYCYGSSCNYMEGAFRSRDYDPRYRGWYMDTKRIQQPNWVTPYPFFTNLELGITYSQPIYSYINGTGNRAFVGVLAVDFTLENISNFLRESYLNSSTYVVVYEKSEPNYIVASSTKRELAKKVLVANNSLPCPEDTSERECTLLRFEMSGLYGYPFDDIIRRAYGRQKEAGYPRDLVSVKESDVVGSKVYISQSSQYTTGNLEWVILVVTPLDNTGGVDSINPDHPSFGIVVFVGFLGALINMLLLILFYRKRKKRAVVCRDWRFTCAFIMGCVFLNLSTLTKLGPNTDGLCLTRIWLLHFFFVVAIAPLFVKVWRMQKLLGSSRIRKIAVSNKKAALYTLPLVSVQVAVLILWSIIDPPRQKEVISIEQGLSSQQIICYQKSIIFNVIELSFEAGLVLVGCVLAYRSRNLKKEFGEARELFFSMYNTAFIGVIIGLIIYVANIDIGGKIVAETIGIFWGTVLSCVAFVVPVLLVVRRQEKEEVTGGSGGGRSVFISGMESSRSSAENPNNINGAAVVFNQRLLSKHSDHAAVLASGSAATTTVNHSITPVDRKLDIILDDIDDSCTGDHSFGLETEDEDDDEEGAFKVYPNQPVVKKVEFNLT